MSQINNKTFNLDARMAFGGVFGGLLDVENAIRLFKGTIISQYLPAEKEKSIMGHFERLPLHLSHDNLQSDR